MTTRTNKPDECPFCGGYDVDPTGWMDGKGNQGPQCQSCGATATSVSQWNQRHGCIAREIEMRSALDVCEKNINRLLSELAVSTRIYKYMHKTARLARRARFMSIKGKAR